jgi:hypothetical protein
MHALNLDRNCELLKIKYCQIREPLVMSECMQAAHTFQVLVKRTFLSGYALKCKFLQ